MADKKMNLGGETKKINITIPVKQFQELQEVGKEKGQSISALIRLAVSEYIEKNKG